MDLFSLRLFCDVVDTGSFTRAAERSGVTQPAVTQRLRALEQLCGTVLLERGRGKGRVYPTESGRTLYEGARQLVKQADDLEARMRQNSTGPAGVLRVATVYSVGLHGLPGKLKPFLAAHPGIKVLLEYSRTNKVYTDVLSGAVDVGIVACPAMRPGIEVLPFTRDPMVVICAPENPLARHREIELRDLLGQPMVAFADDIPTRKLTDERLQAAGVDLRIATAVDNVETIKNLVEIGTGIAIVPENTVRHQVREGTLVALVISGPDRFTRPAGLLLRKARAERAALRAFVDAMWDTSMETG
ncbi:MAG TPA: LysR family transcriptional regulator [Chthonomonadales bacterium]|nr:LysR family transcriptional regulator [Chthonomonadales bacterium]